MFRFLTLCLLFCSALAHAQDTTSAKKSRLKPLPPNAARGLWFSGSYTAQLPQADMAERYGLSHKPGFSATFVTKRNFVAGLEAGVFFSQRVNDLNFLGHLAPNGVLFDASGFPVTLAFNQRGFQIHGYYGKLFNISKGATMHGPLIWAGAGYLQHRTQISFSQSVIPYLDEQYRKGYDKLACGVVLNQFVGYTFFNRRKTINLFAGVEFNEGFTRPMRSFDFSTRTRETGIRNDILIGLKGGIIIPVYFHAKEQDYFFK